jgi:hypothetical protein
MSDDFSGSSAPQNIYRDDVDRKAGTRFGEGSVLGTAGFDAAHQFDARTRFGTESGQAELDSDVDFEEVNEDEFEPGTKFVKSVRPEDNVDSDVAGSGVAGSGVPSSRHQEGVTPPVL